jgi:FkbM family methyltransferase
MEQRAAAALASEARNDETAAARDIGAACDRRSAKRLLLEIADDSTDRQPQAPRQPLSLYGGGELGLLARAHLEAVGCGIAMVVDRNAEQLSSSPAWSGLNVVAPADVPQEFKTNALLAVSVVTSPYRALETALRADGWANVVPFYDIAESFRDRHPLSNGWFAEPFDAEDAAQTSAVLDRWADDASRAHHLQFLAWRRLRQEWVFSTAPVATHDRFFIPEVMQLLADDEVFLDAGAHHGHVIQRFLKATGGAFASIAAIEPDGASRSICLETIAKLPPEIAGRIKVIDALLDTESRKQPFHDGLGYASQIAATGASFRLTTTIDSLELSPTFLKLHLEGAELPALKGARQTIARHRPIIAATTYHNDDGIWRTPAWLMENLEGYRFLMRLHGWCGTGAVVYAIPEERHNA